MAMAAIKVEAKEEEYVYRISTAEEWQELQSSGSTFGGELDRTSGFIHLCNLDQVQNFAKTLQNYFLNTKVDLYLLQIDAKKLGEGLVYEVADGSNGFPHFYGPCRSFSPLSLDAVKKAEKLSLSGTSVSLKSDEVSPQEVVTLKPNKRPVRRTGAKTAKMNVAAIEAIIAQSQALIVQNEKAAEERRRRNNLFKENLEVGEKKLKEMEMERDKEFMMLDTSSMTPLRKMYWKRKQALIVQNENAAVERRRRDNLFEEDSDVGEMLKEMETMKKDEELRMLDTCSMTPLRKKYWKQKQKEIDDEYMSRRSRSNSESKLLFDAQPPSPPL